jgi:biopolymer transport protein ExbB
MSVFKFLRAPLMAASIGLSAALGLIPQLSHAQASAPTADAAAPAPTSMPTPEVKKEVIDNPYGLEALWTQGDFVARGTLIIMLIMSMGSWYIIFTKIFEQRKLMKSANAAAETFWTAGSIQRGAESLEEGSAFRFMAEQGLKAANHHEGTLVDNIDLHTWISMGVQRAVENITSRMQDGLAFLATVGSTAPFVGLFGTVWGIYHALTAIGLSGNASIEKVAGPVGEALIMTAFGLAVAVPAVMGYNWLIRRNKGVMEKVRTFSGDLQNVLLAGKK